MYKDAADAADLVEPAVPLHHQPHHVDRLGEELLLLGQLRLEVEDAALPEEEVADDVLDLLAQGLLDDLGREQPQLAQGRSQADAPGRAVAQRLEELVVVQVAVEDEVLAVILRGVVRQAPHDLAGVEVDPLLALAAADHESARATVVLRPLQQIAEREGGQSS